jgi:hypothetical protein
MTQIQPSIVARLKPELVPEKTYIERGRNGELIFAKKWQPLEHSEQFLDLLDGEHVNVGETAEIGGVIAEITEVNRGMDTSNRCCICIRVQYHHKIEA